jgi:CheY-like chemotaxis protein
VHFAPVAANGKTPVRVLSSVNALMSDLTLFIAARDRRHDLQADEPASASPQKPLDVLALEDREVNRLALAQILDSLGLSYALAETGQAALAILAEREIGLVLADTTLPDMSLGDFMEKARALRNDAPFLAMTPPAQEDTIEDLRMLGFADMAVKPISPDKIGQLLQRHYPPQARRQHQAVRTALHA